MNLLTTAALTFCTVVYDGSKQEAEHLKPGFRLKGVFYATGKKETITSQQAGILVQAAPEGTVEVLEGEPAIVEIVPATAKAAAKKAAEHRLRHRVDPVAALAEIEPLSKEILKGLRGKDEEAAAFLQAGSADAALGNVALYLRLGGREELALLAAQRAEGLAQAKAAAALAG